MDTVWQAILMIKMTAGCTYDMIMISIYDIFETSLGSNFDYKLKWKIYLSDTPHQHLAH